MKLDTNKQVALASFRLIENGDEALAARIIASDFINLEAQDDPDQPERQSAGPLGFLATSQWLREAFSELRFRSLEPLAEGERVVVQTTMSGRHTGPFQAIAPTGRAFEQRQIHVFRLREGQITEHLAQRDDLGLLLQLGWRPASKAKA